MNFCDKNYVFYDLETNGLDYFTTGIMQICIIDKDNNILLNQYTYPFDNRIDGTHIHGIDEQKLINNNAITTIKLCELIKDIFREKFGREDVYLIAYNNFGYDQIILENNFKITNIKMPTNWYFVDLLPIIKDLNPDIKPNYKLGTVYEKLCGSNNDINYHCALGDTTCLYRIFEKIKNIHNIDYVINKYTRAELQNNNILDSPISSLNGYHKSINFESKGYVKIGDIYLIFKNNNYDNIKFEEHLRNKLNMYSDFYIKNLIKNINVIHYLS
jgi:DNA polymerase III alpha subunit (gram-positive type)